MQALAAITLLVNTLEMATRISLMLQKAQEENRALNQEEKKVLEDDYTKAHDALKAEIAKAV